MTQRSGKFSTEWSASIKALFMLLCCTSGMAFATLPANPRVAHPPVGNAFVLHGFPASLLALTLAVSLWLAVGRGRRDTSWAVLSWGSWATIPVSLIFYIFQGNLRDIQGWAAGYAAVLLILVPSMLGGMRAAWWANWQEMGVWWLASVIPNLIIYSYWHQP